MFGRSTTPRFKGTKSVSRTKATLTPRLDHSALRKAARSHVRPRSAKGRPTPTRGKSTFGGTTPRFKGAKSMYKEKETHNAISSPKSHRRFSNRKANNISACAWSKGQTSANRGRFEGHGSYIKAQKGAGRGGEEAELNSDFKAMSVNSDPSAAFKGKERANDWLRVKGEGNDELPAPRSAFKKKVLGGKNSAAFAAKASRFEGHGSYVAEGQGEAAGGDDIGPTHQNVAKNVKGVSGMKRNKHSRFSILGSIYPEKASDGVGIGHKDMAPKPSDCTAAFKGSTTSGRSAWMKTNGMEDDGAHELAEPRSCFEKENEGTESAAFAAKASRFEGHGSYVAEGQGEAAASGALGPERTNVLRNVKKGVIAMKKEKHSRFSTCGSIYNTPSTPTTTNTAPLMAIIEE